MISDPLLVALQVAQALEASGLRYMVGGSLASSIGGEPRSTLDVDILVEMTEADVDRFLTALGPDFHADDLAVRRGVRQRSTVSGTTRRSGFTRPGAASG